MASSAVVATGDPVTVLRADDEPGFAEMTAEFLEEENERFSVVTATSATEGLERLAESDDGGARFEVTGVETRGGG